IKTSGQWINADEAILEFNDPILSARIKVLESELDAANARKRALQADDVAKAQIADAEVDRIADRLANFRAREQALIVRSPSDGVLHIPMQADMPGRFFNQGAELAYIITPTTPTIRVAVTQGEVDLIRQQTHAIEVRLADNVDQRLAARVIREVPAATNELPSAALGMIGGGEIATDPSGADGAKALENIFLFDLAVDSDRQVITLGNRVYVRFEHTATPLAVRWYRDLRQLLLGRFSV
ncbi:MAG: HlyD family efflux transporter periplasmic adaptor subunit, partial [Proteobacteria bacterium]|nr:HlyD family efflux transporter periplasmic adaptor subunit [Pseudomonadota bacterium]